MTATLEAPRTTTKKADVTVQIARDVLRHALGKLAGAVGSGSKALPVAQHVLIQVAPGRLTLSGTDFDIFARVSVSCVASGVGTALLPAKRLTEIVTNLPNTSAVTLVIAGQRATISVGRSTFDIGGMAPAEFPEFPEVPTAEHVAVTASTFLDAITRVVPHASQEDARPGMQVVRLEPAGDGMRVTSLDGYALARLPAGSVSGSLAAPCSIHRTAVPVLARLFSALKDDTVLTIGADDRRCVIEGPESLAIVRLVDEHFPEYEPLIARVAPVRTVVCDRLMLSAAVRRVALVAGATQRVELTVGDTLAIRASDADLGTAADVVPIESEDQETGDALTLPLNASAFTDALDTLGTQMVSIAVQSARHTVLLRGAEQAPTDPTVTLVQPLAR